MKEINNKINELEQKQKQLEREKAKLLSKRKQLEGKKQKLTTLVKQSGFASPQQLIDALVSYFDLSSKPSQKGAVAKRAKKQGKRKRNKMTAQKRDQILADLKKGMTKAAAARKYDFSYIVIAKVEKGEYKSL